VTDDELGGLWDLLRCNAWGYRRDGQPITSPLEWSALHEDLGYVHVRMTAVGEAQVSTVWVGIPQAGSTPERPLIYESMVFGGPLDEQAWRYSTEGEATAGHDHVVALVREAAGMPQEDREGASDGGVAGDC
jgi:hypothetical protein